MPIGPPPTLIQSDIYTKILNPGSTFAFSIRFKLQQKFPDKLTQWFVYFGKKEDDMKNFEVIKVRQGIPNEDNQEVYCQIVLKIPENVLDNENQFVKLAIQKDLNAERGFFSPRKKENVDADDRTSEDEDDDDDLPELKSKLAKGSPKRTFGAANKRHTVIGGKASYKNDILNSKPKALAGKRSSLNFPPQTSTYSANGTSITGGPPMQACCTMIIGWDDCNKTSWDEAIEQYFYNKTLFDEKQADKEKLFEIKVIRSETDNYFCAVKGDFYSIDDNGMSVSNYKIIGGENSNDKLMNQRESIHRRKTIAGSTGDREKRLKMIKAASLERSQLDTSNSKMTPKAEKKGAKIRLNSSNDEVEGDGQEGGGKSAKRKYSPWKQKMIRFFDMLMCRKD